jgi:cell division septal protein FtsQ
MAGSLFRRLPAGRTLEIAEAARIGVLDRPAAARSRALRRGRRPLRLLAALGLVGVLWIALSDTFYVYEAEAVGALRLTGDEVLLASGLVGQHVLAVRPRAVEEKLLSALPTLQSAHVSCRISGRCRISIQERQPIAIWREDGGSYWIDEEGFVFPFDGSWSNLLPITGPLPREDDGRLEEPTLAVLAELTAAELDGDTVVRYTAERGFVLAGSQGWQVVLGSGPGIADKLAILRRLEARLEERGLRPVFVDLRFPGAPYYSLTNSW